MKIIYNFLFSAVALCLSTGLMAQNYVHQVIVLNEGYFNFADQVQEVPVSFGSFDPATETYTHIADIPNARFASDVEVDDMYIYIAADTLLLTFDKDSYQPVATATIPGIRRIALWNDQVLLSKGDIGGFDHYFEARDRTDLSLIYELDTQDGPEYSGEHIQVMDDVAYMAINNGFEWGNYVGRLGRIDLATQSYMGYSELGVNGSNPENVMIGDGFVYTLNNKDFTGSSISKINLTTGVTEYTNDVALNSSCGTSALVNDVVYYQEYAVDKLARYNVATESVMDTLVNSLSYYGMVHNELDDVIYGTSTDFVTQGHLHIMQYDGTVSNSIAVGVSPGNLALDLRTSVSVNELESAGVKVFPNPAIDQLVLETERSISAVQVFDVNGKLVLEYGGVVGTLRLPLNGIPAGVYLLRVEVAGRQLNQRFIKQ